MKINNEEQYKVIVLTRKEIDNNELDNDGDFKDLLSRKLKIENDKFEEVISDWDLTEKYYVSVVRV